MPDEVSLSKKIREWAVTENAERQKQLELEEFDTHRAAEYSRMQGEQEKKAMGRPKKTKTKVIADCIKLVVDRQSNIRHAISTLEAAQKEAADELVREFAGEQPADLRGLKNTMDADVQANINEIKLVDAALSALKVAELVENDGANEQKMKEQLVALVTPVSKKYPYWCGVVGLDVSVAIAFDV